MCNESKHENIEITKLLLKLMVHVYDEENNRNELVDNKNSQMIVLTGVMLTLQATLFSNILVNNIISNCLIEVKWKVVVSLIMIISLILYGLSLYLFVQAYTFEKKFRSAPSTELLIWYNKENEKSYLETIEDLLKLFAKVITFNESLINNKVEIGNKGFSFLKISVVVTIILLIVILIIILF